jgi:hypothetical protein
MLAAVVAVADVAAVLAAVAVMVTTVQYHRVPPEALER